MLDQLLMKLRIPHLDIQDPGSPLYLRRFYLYRGKHRPHVYLHHILRSDYDRALHDHPWGFRSFLLWGSYVEHEFFPASDDYLVRHPEINRKTRKSAPAMIVHQATDRHRLELEKPCWTLVFAGPRVREWGFWTEQGWVQWDKLKQHMRDLMP